MMNIDTGLQRAQWIAYLAIMRYGYGGGYVFLSGVYNAQADCSMRDNWLSNSTCGRVRFPPALEAKIMRYHQIWSTLAQNVLKRFVVSLVLSGLASKAVLLSGICNTMRISPFINSAESTVIMNGGDLILILSLWVSTILGPHFILVFVQ
ncbi:hypothetical protein NPIL_189481 [Nephila pilipes]|uniref:Uncharacterized protein n=1 Tax=Nephila pilipes TaxID=299642 RepID=A0A8X6NKU0_NEPPI|nr:hypothetical protein NPIL_189481 [Nephila pilipes]